MEDLFKKFLEYVEKQQQPEEDWPVVAQLKAEDILRHRRYRLKAQALAGEAEVLVAKLRAVEAQREAAHAELWDYLYSAYSLPRDLTYTITSENQIRKKLKGPCVQMGSGRLCVCGQCK